MSRDLRIVRLFAKPSILRAEVDVGVIALVGRGGVTDTSGAWQANANSCLVPSDWSFRQMEEWVICNPTRIKNITQVC